MRRRPGGLQRTRPCKGSGPLALVTEERRMPSSALARDLRLAAACPVGTALPAGFTLRSCIKEPKDSTSGEGIDHWPSQLGCRRTPLRPGSGQIGQARRGPVVTRERAWSRHGDKPGTQKITWSDETPGQYGCAARDPNPRIRSPGMQSKRSGALLRACQMERISLPRHVKKGPQNRIYVVSAVAAAAGSSRHVTISPSLRDAGLPGDRHTATASSCRMSPSIARLLQWLRA
jgi:hypothetical protein